jgi:hypothetical protein
MRLLLSCFLLCSSRLCAQQVDSICFHLYTDSLKKGTFNYINVDAGMSDGSWKPLTGKEVNFQCSYGWFKGNSLFVDSAFKGTSILVRAILRANPAVQRETTIPIKTLPDSEVLKTKEELIHDWQHKRKKKQGK